MAKLVDPSAVERPVPRQIGGRASLQVPGPSGAEGRGMAQLGSDLERGHDEIYQAIKIEEERANRLRAEDAYTKLREKQLELTVGKDTGFQHLKGADAASKDVLREWTKRFQDAETQIAGTLGNDEQRRGFKARADVARLQYTEEIYRHLAREGDVYAKEVFDGTMGVEQRNAVAKWDSPNDVNLSIDRIRQAVEERAGRYGWPAEYKNKVINEELGKVHSAVIQQAIASGNHVYAQSWYDKHRSEVDLQTAKNLERVVEDATQKQLFNGYQRDYLAAQASRGALGELEKKVTADGTLDDARKNVLLGRIQNRQGVLEQRAIAAQDRWERKIERSIDKARAEVLAGGVVTPEHMGPLISATKGTPMAAEVDGVIKLSNATNAFRLAPPVQQEQALAAGEAAWRADPSKMDRRIITAWKSIHEHQRQAVKESPITFAVQQGIVEALPPVDLSKPEQSAAALSQRFDIARGMQAKYQAPFKPLTPEEANLLSGALKGMNAEQKVSYFSRLFRASGSDMAGYSAMMAQLAPDSPVTAAAGDFASKGRGETARLMLEGQQILHPNRKEDGTPDKGKLWPMPAETDLRKAFASFERDAFMGHDAFRNQVWQSAVAIYAKKSVDAGDASGVVNSSRWEESMKLASGGIERWNGRSTVMPWGYTKSQFKDALSQRIDDVVASGKLPDGISKARLWDMPLEPIGDGRYVFRAGDGILYERNPKDDALRGELGTLRRPDGGVSTEISITVTDKRLNDGKPTNIPLLVRGQKDVDALLRDKAPTREQEDIAIKRAAERVKVGASLPSYGSIDAATKAAESRPASAKTPVPQSRPVIVDLYNMSARYLPPRKADAPADSIAVPEVPMVMP